MRYAISQLEQTPTLDKQGKPALLAALSLALLGIVSAGCAGPIALQSGGVSRHAAPTRKRLSIAKLERSAVKYQATLFMRRFKQGGFAAQWQQLSPVAKRAWPSRSARTAMLRQKFGSVGIKSVGVGVPTPPCRVDQSGESQAVGARHLARSGDV